MHPHAHARHTKHSRLEENKIAYQLSLTLIADKHAMKARRRSHPHWLQNLSDTRTRSLEIQKHVPVKGGVRDVRIAVVLCVDLDLNLRYFESNSIKFRIYVKSAEALFFYAR